MNKNTLSVFALILFFLACEGKKANTTPPTSDSTSQKDAMPPKAAETEMSEEDKQRSGVWYAPSSQEAFIVEVQAGKAQKVRYAKGAEAFEEVKILSQESKGEMMGMLALKLSVKGKPMTMDYGYTPMGAYYAVRPAQNGNTENIAYLISPEIFVYPNASMVFSSFFTANEFESGGEQSEYILSTPQEGAEEGEVFFIYKNTANEEEYITAKIDPKTHELLFTSKYLGKVKAKFNDTNLEIYNPANQPIKTFSMKPKV